MSIEGEFNQDIKKLIRLLKKILRNHPAGDKLPDIEKEIQSNPAGFNLNVFLFPLLPLTPEEMEEFSEIYESMLMDSEKENEELRYSLNQSDKEFLKRHGIRF